MKCIQCGGPIMPIEQTPAGHYRMSGHEVFSPLLHKMVWICDACDKAALQAFGQLPAIGGSGASPTNPRKSRAKVKAASSRNRKLTPALATVALSYASALVGYGQYVSMLVEETNLFAKWLRETNQMTAYKVWRRQHQAKWEAKSK